MKLSATIVLLSIASYAFAQSNNSNSRNTKIDEEEKTRLETQFKALNNFYINDDGLVVYKKQGNQSSQSKQETPRNNSNNVSSASESEGSNATREENKSSSERGSNLQTTNAGRTPAPKVGIIKKEALRPSENTIPNRETVEDTEIKTARNSPTETPQRERVTQRETNVAETTRAINPTPAKSTTKKTSVFDKNKRTTQYKTMEEAALAVESLLEDLRKEQAQTTNAGSMSSRLSGGAGRSTLRKKPTTNPSYTGGNSTNAASGRNTQVIEEESSPFGDEPTYYINGKEVEKIEINRLRRQEIISKEVRTRNTVSGNPNGEIWYEVRYAN